MNVFANYSTFMQEKSFGKNYQIHQEFSGLAFSIFSHQNKQTRIKLHNDSWIDFCLCFMAVVIIIILCFYRLFPLVTQPRVSSRDALPDIHFGLFSYEQLPTVAVFLYSYTLQQSTSQEICLDHF